MSNEKMIAKINKMQSKKKSGEIIKIMKSKHVDNEVLCAGLKALGEIRDEDSVNNITHYLGHADSNVRITACKAGIAIGTEYMKTRVRYQLSVETDPVTKQAIQKAFNEQFK